MFLEAAVALGSPHQPYLEDIDMSTTLDGLVTRIVRHIVVLVLLKQIRRVHLIAVLKDSLGKETKTSSSTRNTPREVKVSLSLVYSMFDQEG